MEKELFDNEQAEKGKPLLAVVTVWDMPDEDFKLHMKLRHDASREGRYAHDYQHSAHALWSHKWTKHRHDSYHLKDEDAPIPTAIRGRKAFLATTEDLHYRTGHGRADLPRAFQAGRRRHEFEIGTFASVPRESHVPPEKPYVWRGSENPRAAHYIAHRNWE